MNTNGLDKNLLICRRGPVPAVAQDFAFIRVELSHADHQAVKVGVREKKSECRLAVSGGWWFVPEHGPLELRTRCYELCQVVVEIRLQTGKQVGIGFCDQIVREGVRVSVLKRSDLVPL